MSAVPELLLLGTDEAISNALRQVCMPYTTNRALHSTQVRTPPVNPYGSVRLELRSHNLEMRVLTSSWAISAVGASMESGTWTIFVNDIAFLSIRDSRIAYLGALCESETRRHRLGSRHISPGHHCAKAYSCLTMHVTAAFVYPT